MTQTTQALLVAVETFVTAARGTSEVVPAGAIAHADSWPVKLHPNAFAELAIDYPDPDADTTGTSAASVSPASLKRRGLGPRRQASGSSIGRHADRR